MKRPSTGRSGSSLRKRAVTLGMIATSVVLLLTLKTTGLVIVIVAAVVEVVILILTTPRGWRRVTAEAAEWRTLRCANCGYDLRGAQTPVCPECGRDSPAVRAWLADAPGVLRANRTSDADG